MLTIHFFASLVQSVAQCDSLICLTSISDSTFFALFFFCFVFFFVLFCFILFGSWEDLLTRDLE